MALLTKAQILAAGDLPVKVISVPEWGGDIRIRALTAGQMEGLQAEFMAAKADGMLVPSHWRAKHLALSAIDEKGELLFTEAEAAQLDHLTGAVMFKVFDAINTFNGAGPTAVTDAAKN